MSVHIKSSDPDPVYILRSSNVSVSALKFCSFHCEEVLIAGTHNGIIQMWNLATKRIQKQFQASSKAASILKVDVVRLSPKEYILSHDRSGKVKYWEIKDGDITLVHDIDVYSVGFCAVDIFTTDSTNWLGFPSSSDSEVSVTQIDFERNPKVYQLTPSSQLGMVMNMKILLKDSYLHLLCGYEDGSVYLWDVVNTELLQSKRIHQEPVMCLDIDSCFTRFISASVDNVLQVTLIDGQLRFQESTTHKSNTTGFSSACIRRDNKVVVCGGWDGKVRVFGWKKLKPLAILKCHSQSVNCISFSEDNLIAAGSKDGKISLWDVYAKQ